MQKTLTYKDIIDDKVAEWRQHLRKLGEFAEKATLEHRAELKTKMEQLRSEIDTAVVRLQELDQLETVANTLETKDKILEIFNSIDKDFYTWNEYQTPFML